MYPVYGGLWGATKEICKLLSKSFSSMLFDYISDAYYIDQNFLREEVWARVKDEAYCSDSVSCDLYNNAFPFPVARIGDEHAGAMYYGESIRESDVKRLQDWGENPNCMPNWTHGFTDFENST